MRSVACLACLAFLVPLHAAEPNVVFERWDSAYLGGVRSGYVHTRVRESAGEARIASTIEMRLQIKRLSETVSLGMDIGTFETPAGFVTGTLLRQSIGNAQKVLVEGKAEGSKLRLTLDGTVALALAPAPWNERVVGIHGQHELLKRIRREPGAGFEYLSFEPSINLIIKTRVTVRNFETVRLPSGTRRLLRVDLVADKIKGFQPPPFTRWLDDDGETIASETEMAGLGKINLYRTTRDLALTPAGAAKTPDANQQITLRQRVLRAHETTSARFRIRIPGDEDAATRGQ